MIWYQALAVLLAGTYALYALHPTATTIQSFRLVLVVLAAVLAFTGLTACNRTNIDAANAAAAEYIKHIPNATGVECAKYDNDGDGYVTCTVFRGKEDPLPIQCGSERWCVNCARGCKYVPIKVPSR